MKDTPMTKPLLIGVGNDFASDDAAGRLVARRLRDSGNFNIAETHGAAADLVTLMEGQDHVIIVDACSSGAAPGTLHRIDGMTDNLPGWLRSVSSHGIGVAEGIQLAYVLGELPARIDILAIEGQNYANGESLTPEVAATIDQLVGELSDGV
ncbi:MAG: hydrogenase maturation protease [Maritimibacter sp.]